MTKNQSPEDANKIPDIFDQLNEALKGFNTEEIPDASVEDLSNQILQKMIDQQATPDSMPDTESWQLLAKLNSQFRKLTLRDEPVEKLIKKLRDVDWQVRYKAAEKLSQLADQRAVEPLINALLDSSEPVRAAVAAGLGKIGDARAVEPLIESLYWSDLSPLGQGVGQIKVTLRNFGASAVEPLIKVLADENPDLRKIAVSLLGEVKDPRALPALELMKQNETAVDQYEGPLRDIAAQAIRSIKGKLRRTELATEPKDYDEKHIEWERLLKDWSIALLESTELSEEPSQEAIEAEWLGYPGATEEQIVAAEARLGTKFPPSYRAFLKVSNGWGQTTHFIYKLWSVEEIDWFSVENQEWIDAYNMDTAPVSDEDYFVYGDKQIYFRSEYLQTALQVTEVGDQSVYLLNPKIVTPEDEWEAWDFANWRAGVPRYRSFWELMLGEYQRFLKMEEN